MLATRSLRLAATRYYSPAVYAWSVQTRTPLKLQQTTTWYTTPIAAAYSKDAKSGEQQIKSSNPSSSSSTPPCTESSSSPTSSPSDKCSSDKQSSSSTGPLSDADVKLPNREQVEGFVFKSLVYIWDFAFYIFALSRKLIVTYVFNNPTVQRYWKLLLQRMDDARKEIKSK